MKKQRLREVQGLAWGHRAGRFWNQDVFIQSFLHAFVQQS